MTRTITVVAAALITVILNAGIAHADPTPPPTPDYTWECDTDSSGHSSCHAEPIENCGLSEDRQWVVVIPTGTKAVYGMPCWSPAPHFAHAPYPAAWDVNPYLTPTAPPARQPPGY